MAAPTSDRNYLARNSAVVTVFRGLGVASGIALDALIVSRLGLGIQTDAFFAAYALPFVMTSVLELQTATVLVPIFVQLSHSEGPRAAYRLIGSVLSAGGLILAALGALGALAAPRLVAVQAPGLGPAGRSLAASLASVLFWLPLLVGASAILRATLNGLHRFAVAASGKMVSNLVAIMVVLIAYQRLGIHALAYGFLLGGAVQLMVLMLAMRQEGFTLAQVRLRREPRLAEVGRLMSYTLLGQTLSESRQLVEIFVASFLPAGSVSALRYASRIVNAISGVMVGGIVTATLPLVSRFAALGDFSQLKRVLRDGVRLLALVALPISAWLALASQPFLAVLFERGRFSSADTALTSTLLVLLVPVIFLSRLVALTQTAFYARKDMLTPLWNIALTVAAYLLAVLLLYRPLGIYGLPVANSVALGLAAATMVWFLYQSVGTLGTRELTPFFAKLSAALAALVAAMMIGAAAGETALPAAPLAELAVASIFGGLAFLAVLALLGITSLERLRAILSPAWDLQGGNPPAPYPGASPEAKPREHPPAADSRPPAQGAP